MFVQAKNFRTGRSGPPQVVIIHTVETPEREGAAAAVAAYYSGAGAPQASMHYIVDDKVVIQTVALGDTAWAAPPLNDRGIQIEHAGYAAQTAADWADAYSVAELELSAHLTAQLCASQNIAAHHLTYAEIIRVIDGDTTISGICGHVEVNAAMKAAGRVPQSSHWDPGPAFPWNDYLATVHTILNPVPAPPPIVQPEEDDMELILFGKTEMYALSGGRATRVSGQTIANYEKQGKVPTPWDIADRDGFKIAYLAPAVPAPPAA